jgi:hypothetical protein
VTTAFLGAKQEGLAIKCGKKTMIFNSEHRKMRAKQQHVCKEMNIYEQYQPEVVFKLQHRMYNRSELPEIAY